MLIAKTTLASLLNEETWVEALGLPEAAEQKLGLQVQGRLGFM